MLYLKLTRKNFLAALGSFSDYQVYAPKRTEDKVHLKEITILELPENLKFERCTHSAKELFLPPEETLFYFKRFSSAQKPLLDETKRLIIGLRPCDARALQVLDSNFLQGGFDDPYYRSRRENSLVLTIACREFEKTCFCDALGLGPDLLNGADAIIYDLGDQVGVLAGNTVLAQRLQAFALETKEVENETQVDRGAVPSREVELLPVKSPEEYFPLIFQDKLWEEIESACLGCGACSYLCPTCYCFDITDVNLGPVGKRIRTYDSCMFNMYTLEASGHNPRPTLKERWRQRFMHKFSYIPYLHGLLGCTGCGRCLEACPSRIDIREVVKYVATFTG